MRRPLVCLVAAALALAAGCARQAAQSAREARSAGLEVHMETRPSPPLSKRDVIFRVRLLDRTGHPVDHARVTLALSMPGMNHGESSVALRPTRAGWYEGRGILVMAGPWEAQATVDWSGGRTAVRIPFGVPR